jgi:hypothetical protein
MSIPISTEARGRLRIWRRNQAARQAELERVLEAKQLRLLADDFVHRGSEKGRMRALLRLRREIDPVTEGICAARLHDNPSALWATIGIEPEGAEVAYLMISAARGISRGPWNLKCTDHALGRFFQRSPRGADLSVALLDANVNIGRGKLYRLPKDEGVLVSAGDGAFRGRVDPGGLDHLGLVQAWTWLHTDQLFEDQESNVVGAAA